MPKDDSRELPTHDACNVLTQFSLSHLPTDPSTVRSRKVPKGALVWQAQDRADRLFLLTRGQVAVLLDDTGHREVIVRIINSGEAFGELCFCSQKDGLRGNSARAAMDSELLEVTFIDLLRHLQNSPDALAAMVFTFCTRLAGAEQRIQVLSHRGAESRLGKLLLHLAASAFEPGSKQGSEVTIVASHDRLAAMAAMTRPHVTVTMRKFREQGLVDYKRGSQLRIRPGAITEYLDGLADAAQPF